MPLSSKHWRHKTFYLAPPTWHSLSFEQSPLIKGLEKKSHALIYIHIAKPHGAYNNGLTKRTQLSKKCCTRGRFCHRVLLRY